MANEFSQLDTMVINDDFFWTAGVNRRINHSESYF